jgi:hypothetical protein
LIIKREGRKCKEGNNKDRLKFIVE